MIVRSKREKNWTVVDNAIINDDRLTWESMALLVYILSKPDHWKTRISHLATVRKAGKDKLGRMVRELENAGYVVRQKYHKDNGQFGWKYTVFDCPRPKNGDSGDFSHNGKTGSGSPGDGSPGDGSPSAGFDPNRVSTEVVITDKYSRRGHAPTRESDNLNGQPSDGKKNGKRYGLGFEDRMSEHSDNPAPSEKRANEKDDPDTLDGTLVRIQELKTQAEEEGWSYKAWRQNVAKMFARQIGTLGIGEASYSGKKIGYVNKLVNTLDEKADASFAELAAEMIFERGVLEAAEDQYAYFASLVREETETGEVGTTKILTTTENGHELLEYDLSDPDVVEMIQMHGGSLEEETQDFVI